MRKAPYEYFAEGRAKKVNNINDTRFDQSHSYDHLGRLKGTTSGLATNSEEEEVNTYGQTISQNAFGNMTSRSATVWGGDPIDFTASYTNNRKTGGNEVFDFSGNVIDKTIDSDDYERWKFDASGTVSEYKKAYETHETPYFDYVHTLTQSSDGDGQLVKRRSQKAWANSFNSYYEEDISYYVLSTPLGGQILTELNGDGDKVKTSVLAGGAEIAQQRPGSTDEVVWRHVDAITGSRSGIKADGNRYWGGVNDSDFNAEIEPVGMAAIPDSDPYGGPTDPDTQPMPTRFKLGGDVFNVSKCVINVHFAPIECSQLRDLASGWGMKTFGGAILFETPYKEYELRDNESKYADALVNEGLHWRMFGDKIGFLIGSGSVFDLVPLYGQYIKEYSAHDRKDDLEAFWKANPNCRKALKKLGIDIKKLNRNAQFTDATSDKSDLGKTYGELGANGPDVDDYISQLKFEAGNARAETIPGTNKIYLFSRYFDQSAVGRGGTIIHELLHVAKGSHVRVAKALGMNIDHDYEDLEITVSPYNFDPLTGKSTDPVTKWTRVDRNDRPASDMIDNWLSNNCTKQPATK